MNSPQLSKISIANLTLDDNKEYENPSLLIRFWQLSFLLSTAYIWLPPLNCHPRLQKETLGWIHSCCGRGSRYSSRKLYVHGGTPLGQTLGTPCLPNLSRSEDSHSSQRVPFTFTHFELDQSRRLNFSSSLPLQLFLQLELRLSFSKPLPFSTSVTQTTRFSPKDQFNQTHVLTCNQEQHTEEAVSSNQSVSSTSMCITELQP